MKVPASYVPLWCKSNYSFLEGASHPDELVAACPELEIQNIGICDRDGVYGIVRAHVAGKQHNIRTIAGSELTVADGRTAIMYPKDRTGYANLCTLISTGRLRNEKGICEVTWSEILEYQQGNVLLAASGAESLPLPMLGDLKDKFSDDLYLISSRHFETIDNSRGVNLQKTSSRFGIPLVAATEVLYHHRDKKKLQDVLTCIKHGVELTEAGVFLKANAEHYLRSSLEFCSLYSDIPQAVEATLEVADKCRFTLDSLVYRYPSEMLPEGFTTANWLRELSYSGAEKRYNSSIPEKVRRQLETELALIEELDYCGYFITMWDIVQFCRKNNIICQGRGSAANSAVCYCLGITAIDPVQMDLLFERFISRERAEPPDIDLDIEHRRREEVIQHMYKKYGRERAAMVANVVRYRRKSAIREVGKVLGIPPTALDMLSKLTSYRGGTVQEALDGTGLKSQGRKLSLLTELITELQDFPRHLSIHPGGFLLGSEPVSKLVQVENATMPDRTVIQWDKYDVEELGLFKVDLLGLGALHHLHYSFDLLKQHMDKELEMAAIPIEDSETYDMLCKGDTVGVFQVESRAQMSMLPRLRPRTYYDIVIEVSIVRPGPIAGGMVHPFLKRRNGEEPVTYPHPSLEPVLKKTLGVPLFQEQVMKLAVIAAGYTPGEADQLRRDMAAWKRQGSIERHREMLIAGMLKNGIAEEFAVQVFEQIRGFGEYGFPESHAASFAYIAYCTAWMKCHYPAIFTCGLLNAWPMGFYSPATIVQDGKRHGIRFLPVDIMKSEWFCSLEIDGEGGEKDLFFAVRMGLRFIRGLGEGEYEKIEKVRSEGHNALTAFLTDSGLPSNVLENLSQSGAFESLGENRRSSLWRSLNIEKAKGVDTIKGDTAPALLGIEEKLPDFQNLNDVETVLWDHVYSGHSTNGHPLEPYRSELEKIGLPDAAKVNSAAHETAASYAGLVICRQLPTTANGTLFITLEDETGFVNCIVWERTFQQYRNIILANSFLGVSGKIQAEQGVTYLVVDSAWKPELNIRRAEHQSHDFR